MLELNFTLVGQVLTFGLLVYLLNRFLYGPMTKALNERTERIKSALEAAERSRDEAQRLLDEYKKQMAESRAQAQKIIDSATQMGRQMREETVTRAKQEAERTVERALAEIEREKLAAIEELKSHVADLSLQIATKLVVQELDGEKHRGLIESYLSQLETEQSEVGSARGKP